MKTRRRNQKLVLPGFDRQRLESAFLLHREPDRLTGIDVFQYLGIFDDDGAVDDHVRNAGGG